MKRVMILAITASVGLPFIGGAEAQTAVSAAGEPLLVAQGGGFIFNYREARAHYGLAVKPQRALPKDAIVEARFDNPAGGPPFVAIQRFDGTPRPIILETPPVTGIRKGVDYQVVVEVKSASGAVIGSFTKAYQSDLDQSVLPKAQLVIGPGYQPNPDAKP